MNLAGNTARLTSALPANAGERGYRLSPLPRGYFQACPVKAGAIPRAGSVLPTSPGWLRLAGDSFAEYLT